MFNCYVVLLALSGVIMLVLAAQKNGHGSHSRALNAIFGAVFVGYAFYLAFIFGGGSYVIFFKAFILPVVMVAHFFRSRTPGPKTAQTRKTWREHQKSE
jgi:fatty acid desaturase